MPTIPKHWMVSEDAGIDQIELPGGIIYDPATGCISGDGICWEQPDLLAVLHDAARLGLLESEIFRLRGQIDILENAFRESQTKLWELMTPNSKVRGSP